MVVANHGPVLSNLYTSAKITPYEVQFSLSLERVMFYNPNVTWHDSWLAATAGMCIEKKSTQDLNFSLGIQTKAKLTKTDVDRRYEKKIGFSRSWFEYQS